MKRKFLLIILLVSSLISVSSSTLFAQSDFTDEYIYLTEGDLYTTDIYPDDYVYEIVLYMDDYSSFRGKEVIARANLHASPDNSGCNISVHLFNGDTGEWVDEYVSAYSPTNWTEWVIVNVDINVSEIYMHVSYTGDASCAAYTELEIRAQGDIPATEENAAQIDFWADDDYLTLGECTYLNWEVDYATDVYFQGDYREHYGYEYVCPNQTTEYELQALGEDGDWKLRTVTIYVEEEEDTPEPYYPPPDLAFWADEYQITSGECVYIYWQAVDAESVWFEGSSVYHDDYEYVCPTSTTTYELEVLGYDGNYYSDSLTITVDEPERPQIDFWADDYTLEEGECTTIYWDVSNAANIYLDGRDDINQIAGSKTVCPTRTTDYLMEVEGLDGQWYSDSFTITVDEEPEALPPAPPKPEPASPTFSIDFWADEYQLTPGDCTDLLWSVEGAQTIILEGPSFKHTVTYDEDESREVCPSETSEYELVVTDTEGRKTTSTVTIRVEEIKVDCTGDDGFLLIVTDSKLLNASTGDSSTWKDVKERLEEYYDSSADGCLGKPLFLDIADVKTETNPKDKSIDKAIERFVKDMKVSSPAAIAIIGGPNVIPYYHLSFLAVSDDYYADFDNDIVPDTVITRLPDGGYKELLINYIRNFTSHTGRLPDDRAVLVTDLRGTAHRLNQYHDLYLSKPGSSIHELFLEDYIGLRTKGEVINIMTPPIADDHYYGFDEYRKVIRGDDNYNTDVEYSSGVGIGTVTEGVEKYLDSKYVIFGDFTSTNDLGHYLSLTPVDGTSNVFQDPTYESAFNSYVAQSFSETSHIFSLATQSALIRSDIDGSDLIPIQALNAGVHHFIGRLENNIGYRNYKFGYDGLGYGDIALQKGAGKFAASYFSRGSADPATSFWRTKEALYSSGDTISAFGFSYLGLPEKRSLGFGKYVQTMVDIGIEPGIISKPPTSEDCKSHDPDDCDGDKIPDNEEFYLASIYAPFLVPDEGEDSIQLPRNHGSAEPFGVFWQVSPAEHAGRKGAWITYVFSYTRDGGIHYVDMEFLDCMSCIDVLGIKDFCNCDLKDLWKIWDLKNSACCAGKSAALTLFLPEVSAAAATCAFAETVNETIQIFDININPNQILFGHPGDNEAFRVFIADDGSKDWELTHVNWKRHHEGFDHKGMLQSLAEAKDYGLTFYQNSHHPLLYASEDKHAMYPTAKICEEYDMEFVSGCVISFEDCGGHPIFDEVSPIKTRLVKEFNVGEREGTYTVFGNEQRHFNLREKLDPVFPDEYAWEIGEDDHFCGNIFPKGGALDEDCGGPMGKIWFPVDYSITIEF